MKILTNRDTKKLMISLTGILSGSLILSQLVLRLTFGTFHLTLLLLSLLTGAGICAVLFLYLSRQEQLLLAAAGQVDCFIKGDTATRIDSDYEGSLYKLFHAVNILATTLDAQAAKEEQAKIFLKNTISDISHQLKTPIAALSIYHSLLLEESFDAAAVQEFAAKSECELDRINLLVQNLLKITRLDAGAIVMERKPEPISRIAETVYRHFETRMGQEQKQVRLSGPPDAILYCDRLWMTEAISNMVQNALDHTGPGSEIRIEWQQLPALTQICITDTGSGIHPEDIHHIFKRFYRSRFSQDIKGAGLGLPLAKAIIEAHDGYLSADSSEQTGTVFTLSFTILTKL